MSNQLIFQESYLRKLKADVNAGKSLEYYSNKEFVFDKSKILSYPKILRPDGLVDKLIPDNDFESARLLFEAYETLPLMWASDERFWTYLTHVDLFPFVQKRWPRIFENDFRTRDQKAEYILTHWFLESPIQDKLIRHSLAGLWWSVYLSIDEERQNRYELTQVLFRQQDFRTRTLGVYKMARHKNAMKGILEFILENEKLFESGFQEKSRLISKYFNQVGGAINLSFHDKLFFKNELERIDSQIVVN
ncbi:DUF6339 family protein [Reichenbachiella sp.]|uniref:DUF6339 family protein n=1 Tax=Reichenbachiella sp. TaxID=2184521 RepID=UPI00329747BE